MATTGINPNPAYTAITLAGLSVPGNADPSMRKFLSAVKQHLELAHGSSTGASKERFVTLEELRKAGLISVGTKRGRAEIISTAEGQAADTATTSVAAAAETDFTYLEDPTPRQRR